MIVVFSGTTEGRRLSSRLAAEGAAVTVCVATGYGAAEQGAAPGLTVHTGRMEAGEMAALLAGAALCVDATHPYARQASENIRAACRPAGVPFAGGGACPASAPLRTAGGRSAARISLGDRASAGLLLPRRC